MHKIDIPYSHIKNIEADRYINHNLRVIKTIIELPPPDYLGGGNSIKDVNSTHKEEYEVLLPKKKPIASRTKPPTPISAYCTPLDN